MGWLTFESNGFLGTDAEHLFADLNIERTAEAQSHRLRVGIRLRDTVGWRETVGRSDVLLVPPFADHKILRLNSRFGAGNVFIVFDIGDRNVINGLIEEEPGHISNILVVAILLGIHDGAQQQTTANVDAVRVDSICVLSGTEGLAADCFKLDVAQIFAFTVAVENGVFDKVTGSDREGVSLIGRCVFVTVDGRPLAGCTV